MPLAIPVVDTILQVGGKLIDKLFPDPAEKQRAQLALLELAQNKELEELKADVQLALAQASINEEEAKSDNWFKSNWRPFIGWVCGVGLAYQYLLRPLISWIGSWYGITAAPSIELGDLMVLLFGMLGFGGMRMTEKLKGVAK